MPSPSLCVTVYVNVAVVSIFSEKKICPSTWAEGVRKKKELSLKESVVRNNKSKVMDKG